MANIAKHADATKAGLTLTYMHDVVSLDVLDDGKGFDPRHATSSAAAGVPGAQCPSAVNGTAPGAGAEHAPGAGSANGTGFGLSAMRHRLRQVGGSLEIESAPGDGTTLSASVPALYRAEEGSAL